MPELDGEILPVTVTHLLVLLVWLLFIAMLVKVLWP